MKQAFIRAVRTAAQTLAALLVALPTAHSLLDVQTIAQPILLAVYGAALAGLISFLQNVAEDKGNLDIPKG